MKYSIFHVQGGIGKHVVATGVAKAIKNAHPDRQLIVVCAYPEIFLDLDFVERVFPIGNLQYFYQTYIQDKDSLIFHNEPYFTTDHVYKKLPLAETWCKMYDIPLGDAEPVVHFNGMQIAGANGFWRISEKPIMVIHTNGGMMTANAKPYAWTRDMPEDIARQLVDHYKDKYEIFQITKLNSPKIEGANPVFATPERSLSIKELFSILLVSEKQILIDSCLQHAAAALKRPSTVLWNGTSPVVFGHKIHDNIATELPYECKLPGSYLFDFDFDGHESEYPYKDGDKLFDIDQIIASVDAQPQQA